MYSQIAYLYISIQGMVHPLLAVDYNIHDLYLQSHSQQPANN